MTKSFVQFPSLNDKIFTKIASISGSASLKSFLPRCFFLFL